MKESVLLEGCSPLLLIGIAIITIGEKEVRQRKCYAKSNGCKNNSRCKEHLNISFLEYFDMHQKAFLG